MNCIARTDGGPCVFSPAEEYAQKKHTKAPVCCEHCGKEPPKKVRVVGAVKPGALGTVKSLSAKLKPQEVRAVQVVGLLLLDMLLGDENRTLTRIGAPFLLTPEEHQKLQESLANADAALCALCKKGTHNIHAAGVKCSCSCTIPRSSKKEKSP